MECLIAETEAELQFFVLVSVSVLNSFKLIQERLILIIIDRKLSRS